jgi:2-phospho-L-lactate guanylyltransferase
MDSDATRRRFAVIVPVKPPVRAKSRLATLGDAARVDLVRAFAFDTVSAAVASPSVGLALVVTDDAMLASEISALGASVIPDGGSELNESLVQAAAEASRRAPGMTIAAVCADLPALTGAELTAVLDACPRSGTAFLPDAAGTGTTMYFAVDVEEFAPRFGIDSADAHRESGAVQITWSSDNPARRDVDTPEDLESLRAIGLGAHTRAALTLHRL